MSVLFNICMTMCKVTLTFSFFILPIIIAGKFDQHISSIGQWTGIPEKSLGDCTVVSTGFVQQVFNMKVIKLI